jgi:hypothetical protein
VLDFARAVLDQAGYKTPEPQPEPVGASYADAMWRFSESVDKLQSSWNDYWASSSAAMARSFRRISTIFVSGNA